MKRRRPAITLWEAAFVRDTGESLEEWWGDHTLRRRMFGTVKGDTREGATVDDFPSFKSSSGSDNDNIPPKTKREKGEERPLLSCYQVGLKPTKRQRERLRTMLRVHKTTINWCKWLVDDHGVKPVHRDLQKYVATKAREPRPYGKDGRISEGVKDGLVMPGAEWIFDLDLPSTQARSLAAKSFAAGYRSAQKLQKLGWQKKKNKVDMHGVKDPRDTSYGSFGVEHRYIDKVTDKMLERRKSLPDDAKEMIKARCFSILPELFHDVSNPRERFIKTAKPIAKLPPVEYDSTITKRRNGKWVLNIICDARYVRKPVKTPQVAMCGLDPGARVAFGVFDETRREAWELGLKSDLDIIKPMRDKAKRYGDDASTAAKDASEKTGLRARRLDLESSNKGRAAKKVWEKLKYRIKHIHEVVCRHFVANYGLVSLGDLGVSQVVKKNRAEGGLPRSVKDDLHLWKHHDFRERLKHRGRESGCTIVILDESFTSVTCGVCGKENKTLGTSKIFDCPSCGYRTDRDINGARNILQKTLGLLKTGKSKKD